MSDYDDVFEQLSPRTACANSSAHRPRGSHGEDAVGNGRLGKSSEKQRRSEQHIRNTITADADENVPPTAAGWLLNRHATSTADTDVKRDESSKSHPPKSESAAASSTSAPQGSVSVSAKKLQELRSDNLALRRELLELNRKLDYHLLRQGLDLPAPPAVPRPGAMLPRQKLQLQIEHRRKTNAELRRKLSAAAPFGGNEELDELRKTYALLNQRLDSLRSENKGLENVFAHQRSKLNIDEKRERELLEHRRDHSDKVSEIKERIRDARLKREQESVLFQKHVRGLKRLEEVLRLYEELGKAWTSLSSDEVERKVREQDDTLGELQKELAAFLQQNAVKQKRRRKQEERQRELHALNKEFQKLQQTRPES